jgi:uncharacterized protein
MALSNYLLQAALIVPVCIGFGLFDRVTPRLSLLLALAVWSVQLPLSVWWLRRFSLWACRVGLAFADIRALATAAKGIRNPGLSPRRLRVADVSG